MSAGADAIAAERQRQMDVEGWTPEHDAEHDKGELVDGARAYLAAARYCEAKQLTQPMPAWARDQAVYWPWDEEFWKPADEPIRNLVKAGALIAAEIDRLVLEAQS